jgi:hypothetical protein
MSSWSNYDLGDIDKLTELYSIRIPEILKAHIDKLSPRRRKALNDAVLIAMARVVHEARFDSDYLDYLKATNT